MIAVNIFHKMCVCFLGLVVKKSVDHPYFENSVCLSQNAFLHVVEEMLLLFSRLDQLPSNYCRLQEVTGPDQDTALDMALSITISCCFYIWNFATFRQSGLVVSFNLLYN